MNIVLFDGVCNLCNRTVSWLIKHDKNNTLRFAAQQSNAGERIKNQYSVSENCQSVLLIKNERVYYQSDAIIEMAKLLKGWPRIIILFSIIPRFIRDGGYAIIANNRYAIFGKQPHCTLPSASQAEKFIMD